MMRLILVGPFAEGMFGNAKVGKCAVTSLVTARQVMAFLLQVPLCTDFRLALEPNPIRLNKIK